MASKRNIIAAKRLVKKYRSITINDCKPKNGDFGAFTIANNLTGYGKFTTCTLCRATVAVYDSGFEDCTKCIYGSAEACHRYKNKATYNKINNAKTPKGLLKAFQKRADHIEKILIILEA